MATTSKPTTRRSKPTLGKGGGAASLAAHREEKAREKRVVNSKYDWEGAREKFIGSEKIVSLKEISETFGIPYSYVRQRAGEERWTYLRVEEQRRLFKKQREETSRKRLAEATKFDESSIATATLGQVLVMQRLKEIADLHAISRPAYQQALETLKAGGAVSRESLYSAIRYTELRELALAAKLFQDMGRLAFGVEAAEAAHNGAMGDDSIEHVISVAGELGKDDPKRLVAVLEAFARTGLVTVNLNLDEDDDDAEVVEGEVVNGTDIASKHDAMKELTAQ